MIDHLSTFSKKIVWLLPLFLVATAFSFIVFGYVVFIEKGTNSEIYIIPSIIGLLWSLICSLLLSVFPYVPPKPDKHQRLFQRVKIHLIRGSYHLGALCLCTISVTLVLLTLRLFNVWRVDY